MGWQAIWQTISDPRVVASYRLSVGAALAAAAINAVFGLLVAWVLARYRFPGRRIVDALIDLPFALPTAVAGITLTTLYAPNGWLGAPLERYGIKVAFTPLGITMALVFIGLPFVVRTLQPVIEDLDVELEEAATSLGASRATVLPRIILPYLFPAWLTGFALCVRAGGRRVRLGRVHLGQHADADGDLAAADHHEARAVRLRGRDGHRARHAADFVHAAAHRQRAAGLEQQKAGALMSTVANTRAVSRTTVARATGLTEPAAVRWVLTAVALLFLVLFLACRSRPCFTEAFAKVAAYVSAIQRAGCGGGAEADAASPRPSPCRRI